jgi:NTE family protein
MPNRFEDLEIKTIIVATNYLDRNEVAYDAGPLRPAVAGSLAILGLFRPVIFGDEVLIDGGAVNPLPYDLLFGLADIIVAVDVTFGGRSRNDGLHRHSARCSVPPKLCKQRSPLKKSKLRAPDILVRPKVEHFVVLDFFRASHILRAAEGNKEEFKLTLGERMKAHWTA